MTEIYNCAKMIERKTVDGSIYYEVNELLNIENPYNIPEDWKIVAYADFTFSFDPTAMKGQVADAALDSKDVPQYLIADENGFWWGTNKE